MDPTRCRPLLTRLTPLLFVLLWSTGFIGAKFGLPYAEPLSFLLDPLRARDRSDERCSRWRCARPGRQPDARRWFHIGVSGCWCMPCTSAACSCRSKHGLPAGYHSTGGGHAAAADGGGAGVFLGENVTARQWVGLALGFVGVAWWSRANSALPANNALLAT
jgi:drug/metabolite transporter (DMT)-like permease